MRSRSVPSWSPTTSGSSDASKAWRSRTGEQASLASAGSAARRKEVGASMVEESKQKAPGTVVALGSLWLIATAGSVAWALSLLVVFGVVSTFTPGGLEGMPEPPPIAEPIHWAFQHYALVDSVVGVLALFGVYSGVKFLRLRPWARGVLEAG